MRKDTWNKLIISSMTLGTAQLGFNYGYGIANRIGKPETQSSVAIIDEALALGITCLDTASQYGDAETLIGQYLSGSDKFHIATKVKLEHIADGKDPVHSLEKQFFTQLESSLERLGLNRIPILLLHNSMILQEAPRNIMQLFNKAIKDGMIEYAGVSLSADIDLQMGAIWTSILDDIFEVLQIPVNLFDHRLTATEGWNQIRSQGKLIFARSIFLQGLLFLNEQELPFYLSPAREKLLAIHRISEREGISPAQLAVSYIRDLPGVHSLVIGVESIEQLRENIHLLEGPAISEVARADIKKMMPGLPEMVLNPYRWEQFK